MILGNVEERHMRTDKICSEDSFCMFLMENGELSKTCKNCDKEVGDGIRLVDHAELLSAQETKNPNLPYMNFK